MIWWFKPRSRLVWRTAPSCGSTPRWSRPTFIIRPTTPCCGMWCAPSRAWSAALPRRWRCDASRVSTIANMRGKDLFAAMRIDAIRDEIAHYCGLGERVIDQARRRVLDGEQVPNAEKIYSIFEPHTDLIKRGKVRTPVEFGHKVFLAESAKGLITQYEVLKGNPTDEVHVAPSLRRHRRAFRRAPELEGAERFALFVGAAVLANNLMIVAALLTRRSPRRRKATR